MQSDAPHFGATPEEGSADQSIQPQFGTGNTDQSSPTFGRGNLGKSDDAPSVPTSASAKFPPNLQDFDDELDKCTNVDRLSEAQQHIADFLVGFDENMKGRIAKAFPRSVRRQRRQASKNAPLQSSSTTDLHQDEDAQVIEEACRSLREYLAFYPEEEQDVILDSWAQQSGESALTPPVGRSSTPTSTTPGPATPRSDPCVTPTSMKDYMRHRMKLYVFESSSFFYRFIPNSKQKWHKVKV